MNPTALIRSTSSLNRISRSLTGFSSGITRSSFLARNIAKSINADNRFKKSVIETEKTFFRKRLEARLRKRREDNIESSSLNIGNVLKKQSKVLADTGKGFFTRLLDFLGLTILGWIVTNIPKIIKSITNLLSKVKELSKSLQTHIANISNFLGSMGKKLIEIRDNFNIFNFEENITESEREFKRINDNINRLNFDFVTAVNEYADTSDLKDAVTESLNIPDMPDGEDTDLEEEGDDLDGITTMATGGLLKEGETAIVGDDPTGQGKESRELIVADKDLQVIPNNVLGSLESIASNISGEKTKEALVSNQNKITKEKKEIALYENLLLKAEERLKQYIIDDDAKRKAGVSRKITFYKNLIAAKKNELEEFEEKLEIEKSRQIIEATVGSKNFEGKFTQFNSELTPAISSLMEQLKNTGEEIKPQLKDASDQISDVIDTPEIQDKIQSIKSQMQGVIKEITPERKGQIISIPIGSNSSSPLTVPVPMKQESQRSGGSKGLNTNEYYKHFIALITAYT
tara:strand:+ start:1653 stop:3200 length:1548 start_codon:yes stop_codon:yes gene_type:complete